MKMLERIKALFTKKPNELTDEGIVFHYGIMFWREEYLLKWKDLNDAYGNAVKKIINTSEPINRLKREYEAV